MSSGVGQSTPVTSPPANTPTTASQPPTTITSPTPVTTTTPSPTTTTPTPTVIIDTTTTPTPTTTPVRTTTTPPSNPTTTTTPDVVTTTTTPRNQGGTTTTTPTPTPSTSTVVFSTVVVTTDQNGQVETQTVRSTQLVFPTNTPSSSGATSSNVGAIAGGVVGGAVGILALILVIFFCLKRRKRPDDFDGNFDPDRLDPERFGGSATRPGALPNVDLVGAEVVTPFNYQADPAPQKGYDPYGQMTQRPEMPVPVVNSPPSGYGRSDIRSSTTGSHYPTTITEQSMSGGHNQDWRGPSPGPSLATSGTLPSSKDREHTSGGSRFQVSNNGDGGSGQGGSNAVVQHRDAGRLQHPSVPEEIPPSYDSISPDERSAAGASG